MEVAKMSKCIKYTVFTTDWGFFGLAVSEKGLVKTALPVVNADELVSGLLDGIGPVEKDMELYKPIRELIKRYYGGDRVDFPLDIAIDLDGFTEFFRRILSACRQVKYSETISYSCLARIAVAPNSARPAGTVLSKNPLPLIIPCHRVICCDGSIGGFSARGGVGIKSRMLALEADCSKTAQGR